jgi:hypothetical protein
VKGDGIAKPNGEQPLDFSAEQKAELQRTRQPPGDLDAQLGLLIF